MSLIKTLAKHHEDSVHTLACRSFSACTCADNFTSIDTKFLLLTSKRAAGQFGQHYV